MDASGTAGTAGGLRLVLALALAALAYSYGLGRLHVPRIGDEAAYLHVTRLTAASGRLLPLQGEEGLANTKPPLLFWMGMAASGMGRAWDLARLRLPVLLLTLGVAGLCYHVARRLGGRRRTGALAAASYLAFFATFQYGRPFLTNAPETFFVFLPFALLVPEPQRLERWGTWSGVGLATGAACLTKSVALVVPVGVALAAWSLVRRRRDLGAFLRRDVPRGLWAALLAVACFALWPLLDPDPAAVWRDFVVRENVAKVSGAGTLRDLLLGPHSLWTTMLGPFFNAGFLLLPVAWLSAFAWRRCRVSAPGEVGLWMLVLAFVLVFSLVRHRQANYLLPASPALAVLLALHAARIPPLLLRLSAVAPAVVGLGALAFALLVAPQVLPAGAPPVAIAVPALTLLLGLLAVGRGGVTLVSLAGLTFLSFLSITLAVEPFDGPAGRYADATVAAVRGERVWVPATFRARAERHRFLLPGADVAGYPAADEARRERLLASGAIVAVTLPLGREPPAGTVVLGERLDLRTRQTPEEIRDLLLGLRADVLVQREVLLRLAPAAPEPDGAR